MTSVRSVILVCAALVVIASAAPPSLGNKPPVCDVVECPQYKVQETFEGYEVREYEPMTWIGTEPDEKPDFKHIAFSMLSKFMDRVMRITQKPDDLGCHFDNQALKGPMFDKLWKYSKGHNKNGETLPMTAPYATRLRSARGGGSCEKNFIAAIFSSKSAAETPEPLDESLMVKSFQGTVIYVRSFGGFATTGRYMEELAALGRALDADGRHYNKDNYLLFGFDKMSKMFGRHNEVAVMKDTK